jgi:hypothetical protein
VSGRRVFLTAEWRYLAILNFRIDPTALRPLVPAGTELDTWRGDALVSLVGFRFLDTRVAGVPVPFHRSFDEVNLRFYVRHGHGDDRRRGVTFIREIVARRAVAWLARLAYNEPYVTLPMRSAVPAPGALQPGRVEYTWRSARGWNRLAVEADGAPELIAPGSEAEFVAEHYWGYTRQADGSTLEYEVAHPRWRTWAVTRFEMDCDVNALYGPAFVEALGAAPCSALLAEGSAVTVFRPRPLPAPAYV